MNEQELASALRDLMRQYASETDTGAGAAHIIGRDKWRVRLLASLSIFFWLLGIAGLILLVLALDRLVVSIRIADAPAFRGGNMLHGPGLLHHSVPIILGSVVALLLGASLTLVLILTSRHATLRQINTSLGNLTQQISELRHRASSHDTQPPPSAFHTRDL